MSYKNIYINKKTDTSLFVYDAISKSGEFIITIFPDSLSDKTIKHIFDLNDFKAFVNELNKIKKQNGL